MTWAFFFGLMFGYYVLPRVSAVAEWCGRLTYRALKRLRARGSNGAVEPGRKASISIDGRVIAHAEKIEVARCAGEHTISVYAEDAVFEDGGSSYITGAAFEGRVVALHVMTGSGYGFWCDAKVESIDTLSGKCAFLGWVLTLKHHTNPAVTSPAAAP